MTQHVKLETDGALAVLVIDNPPVNAISRAVVSDLDAALARIEADASLRALVVRCAGSTFVAGGDIREFDRPDFSAKPFNAVLARIEALPIPVVAALHGTALGGGLELALACHWRVADAKARVGLPEVKLGLLPGSLGTQRLPRLIGAEAALDLILSGRMVDAAAAARIGLVDEIVVGELPAAAARFALRLADERRAPRRSGTLVPSAADRDPALFARRRAEIAARARHYPALPAIVDCVEAAASRPFADGAALEAEAFEALRASPQSAALRHLFFAEREVSRIPDLPAETATRPVGRVGVVGAGTMGGGIAMTFANAGLPVTLVEVGAEALDRGLGTVRRNYEAAAARGRMSADQVAARMDLIAGTLDYGALAACDLVVEAVVENMALKTRVAAELGRVCRPGAIIATNTSTLDVDALALASGRPGDFLGMHFFSPANVMRLLEVVRGARTAPDGLATVMRLARRIGKVAVVSGVCYGFIGNRMLESYMREADFLLMEGVPPARIDAAIEALGLPMGPCRMLDLAGLDVAAKVVIERRAAGGLPDDPSYRAPVQAMLELGRLGQKTGAGYYRYDGRKPTPDPQCAEICAALARRHGIAPREHVDDAEIVERCLYPVINEGARILEEGIALRPGDVDVVWVNGYGFPDHLGGPLHWADRIGMAT
ncbi:MAG: enoyl-CoA hydratase/isomerase family protein, partial [Alphaproteobacteria bacterium]|nr:enoyl-CoA hydratase/isomerase family protein [Alphaproteobacteria bacterium]